MLEGSRTGIGGVKSWHAIFTPLYIWHGEYFSRVTPINFALVFYDGMTASLPGLVFLILALPFFPTLLLLFILSLPSLFGNV